jgi:hypothetical protein
MAIVRKRVVCDADYTTIPEDRLSCPRDGNVPQEIKDNPLYQLREQMLGGGEDNGGKGKGTLPTPQEIHDHILGRA